jgi:hypothetical protein
MRWFDWSQSRLRVALVSALGSLVLTPLASGCSGDAHAAIETEEGPESRDPEVLAARRNAAVAEEELRQAAATAERARSTSARAESAQAARAEAARAQEAAERARLAAQRAEEERRQAEARAFERAYPLEGITTHFLARVYSQASTGSAVIGYMRRGSRFRATERQATRGCAGGWYRVPGGGFVCRGDGYAVGHGPQSFSPVPREPALEDALPYTYAYAVEDDVPQFWGLPDATREAAVRTVLTELRQRESAREARARAPAAPAREAAPSGATQGAAEAAPEGTEAAPDEAGGEHAVEAPPPPGQVESAEDEGDVQLEETPAELPDYVRMRMQKGFYVSLDSEERVEGRTWYRTVRGAYVRASQMRQSEPAPVRGVVVGGRWSLPIAFVYRHGTRRLLRRSSDGSLLDRGVADIGTPIAVTERTRWRRNDYAVGHDGSMFRTSSLRNAERRDRPEGVPTDGRWIHVDLSEQTLVAYEGDRPVFATIVSTGAAGFETPRGLFRIQSKHVSTTMDNLAASDGQYSIEDVPWTMYFEGNYALHGAFWHSNFGRVRSHGCVNLAPTDARWLFRWSTPTLPESWHGAFATRSSPGTHVLITE